MGGTWGDGRIHPQGKSSNAAWLCLGLAMKPKPSVGARGQFLK